MKKALFFASFLVFSASFLFAQAKLVPVGSVDISGGQYFFRGKNTDLGSSVNILISPSLILSDKTKIVPTYNMSYRGVRTIEELAGGGFLTQETLNYFMGLRYVSRIGDSPWLFKPYISFKLENINESTDESFGNGLFDWWKYSGGVEVEREGKRLASQRFTVAYYGTQFPNYRSLASNSVFGSELNTGTKVLNFKAIDLSYALDAAISAKMIGYAALLASQRPYDDQNIVTQGGTYENKKRADTYMYGGAGAHYLLFERSDVKFFSSLGAQYARLDSNQNSFDATRTKFTLDYYNYADLTLSPSFTLQWKKHKGTAGYNYTWRTYDERRVQDAVGTYHDGTLGNPDEKILQYLKTVTLDYSFLFLEKAWGDLFATLRGAYRKADSNMAYEAVYRYNYETAHYFAGLSMDFGGK